MDFEVADMSLAELGRKESPHKSDCQIWKGLAQGQVGPPYPPASSHGEGSRPAGTVGLAKRTGDKVEAVQNCPYDH